MKGYCIALIILSASLLAIIPGFDTAEADTYESPFGAYGYMTHGTGSDADPYWSNITSFDSSDRYVTIQTAMEGYPMIEISEEAFGYCKGMTDLVLPATLKRIGPDAFTRCGDLQRIYFLGDSPDIGSGAVPRYVEIYCLSGTRGWSSDTSILPLLTYYSGGFALGYYIMDGRAVIHSLISGKDIVIPSAVTAGGDSVEVSAIGNEAFKEKPITSVDIADTVTVIGVRAFYYCTDLETAVLPTSLRTVCDEAFRMCSELNNIDLHDPEYIGFEAFRMCYSFTEIVIPDSVTVMHEGAFRVCSGVVSLTIGSGITEIPDYAFDHYSALESVEIRGRVMSVGDSAFFNVTNFMPKLEKISLPYAETIGSSAFYGCIELKEVVLGESLKEIGPYAFYDCRNLQTFCLPASLEKVGDMAFYNTRELADIYFAGNMPEFGTDVFLDSGATVHCKESNRKSWSGFSGELIVDSSKSPVDILLLGSVLTVLVIVAAIWVRRYIG